MRKRAKKAHIEYAGAGPTSADRARAILSRDSVTVMHNSPIEFAIIGPVDGQDSLLVMSENAGLDVIGKAALPDGYSTDRSSSSSFFRLLTYAITIITRPSQVSAVVGGFVVDHFSKTDKRTSKLRFSWKGFATPLQIKRIASCFIDLTFEIDKALNDEDDAAIQYQVSQLISMCVEAHNKCLSMRKFFWLFSIVYLIAVISALAITASLKPGMLR